MNSPCLLPDPGIDDGVYQVYALHFGSVPGRRVHDNFLRRDMHDLLAQLWTWQHGDIAANDLFRGDLPMALASIKAKVLLMEFNRYVMGRGPAKGPANQHPGLNQTH